VAVVVAMVGAVRVEQVLIEGKDLGVSREELLAVVAQGEGEPLLEDRVLRSLRQLRDLLSDRGYLAREVTLRVDSDERGKTATVVFEVAAGPRATLGAIEFGGAAPPPALERADLLKMLDLEEGGRYSRGGVLEGRERLQAALRRRGFVQAEVSSPLTTPAADLRSVALRYDLSIGRRLDFELLGAERKQLEKRDLLPFLGEEGYDEATVLQAVDRIRRHYQERGHYSVTVEREETITDEAIRLRIRVVPGPILPLAEVAFAGNESVADERLARLMVTSKRRAFSANSGRLVDEVLDEDLANIRSFYALEGYGAARVGPPRIENDGQELRLTVPIAEGTRALVERLTLDGAVTMAERFDEEEELRRLLPLSSGGPYHPLLVQGAVDALRAVYEEAGYEGTQVSAHVGWSETRADPGVAERDEPPERSRALVDLRVFEGTPIVVDRVVVRGSRRTDNATIARVVGLERGDRASTLRLLEAQRRLYALGIFKRVEVSFSSGSEEAGRRDVLVRLAEGKAQRFTYSLGYDSEEGPRGLIGYSHGNLFGRALRGQIDARASGVSEEFRLVLFQPYAWGLPVQVNHILFSSEEERESFRSDQLGIQVQANREWLRRKGQLRAGLLYAYRLVDLTLNPEVPVDENEITREQQDVQISSFTPGLVVDRRDDPINPTRGWFAAFLLEEAFEMASANEEFTKLFVQGTTLRPAGGLTIAASLRFAAIQPHGDSGPPDLSLPQRLVTREIPISERLFGGGRTTHRAYGRDLLGIRGQTLCRTGVSDETADLCRSDLVGGDDFYPTGGNGLALLNLDLRFPIVGSVGGVVFADGGNIWDDWRNIDLNQAKWGAGVGVRYLSPIGPLRAEIGWKLDREPGESAYEVRLSFGNPF
jgi:outer membrane protein insertion porin family